MTAKEYRDYFVSRFPPNTVPTGLFWYWLIVLSTSLRGMYYPETERMMYNKNNRPEEVLARGVGALCRILCYLKRTVICLILIGLAALLILHWQYGGTMACVLIVMCATIATSRRFYDPLVVVRLFVTPVIGSFFEEADYTVRCIRITAKNIRETNNIKFYPSGAMERQIRSFSEHGHGPSVLASVFMAFANSQPVSQVNREIALTEVGNMMEQKAYALKIRWLLVTMLLVAISIWLWPQMSNVTRNTLTFGFIVIGHYVLIPMAFHTRLYGIYNEVRNLVKAVK